MSQKIVFMLYITFHILRKHINRSIVKFKHCKNDATINCAITILKIAFAILQFVLSIVDVCYTKT